MTDIKKLSKSKIEFEITVSWDKWKEYLNQAVSEASSELRIPGFRPGRAPKHMVEEKVGQAVLLNNAAEKAVRKSYVEFVEREKLEAIGQPKVEVISIEEGKDLIYKAEVAVMPEIKVDAKYKEDIKKINEEFSKETIEAKDEEVDLELDKLANSRVKLVTVMREAKLGDSVEIDFDVLVGGVPIENGSSKNHPLILGRGVFVPGFEDNLVGMSEGERKEFELEFPQDYHKKDLAGKPAMFKVKMNLVQDRQIPEVNDEFAKSLGKFENLEALTKSVKDGIIEENKEKAKNDKSNRYTEVIVGRSEVDLPEVLVHEEIHSMMHEFESQISMMGMTLDDYLKKLGKNKEELEHDWEPQAEKRVKSAMAIKQIAKEEKLEASSSEIEEEMNKVLQYYKKVNDIEKNIDMERLYDYCRGVVENEKVIKFLEIL